jgi:hypothetical protein
MFYLENLSSKQIKQGVAPWDFKPATPIPDSVRTDKEQRDVWINASTTKHHVYSFNCGVNPNFRISAPRDDGEGNPATQSHGLVADFDSPQKEELVLEWARKLPYAPNWIEKTLSGNWRHVWELEEPLVFPSHAFAKFFFRNFAKFAFDVSGACPGFDKGAWEAVERLWTNGCDWRQLHDKKIPAAVSRGWLVKASQLYDFKPKEFGTEIPLEAIIPELQKRYPRFCEWPGEFALKSQGPSFWIDQSTSPKSAIVHESGIQTFSAHAARGFYSWKDLLGVDFVKEYEATSAAAAIDGIYWDGKHYWCQNKKTGVWVPREKGDLISVVLHTKRNVSQKADKTGKSPMDFAIANIQEDNHVEGVGPYIYRPPGLILRNGARYLNTSNLHVMAPAPEKAIWGLDGQMPWVSSYLDGFFQPGQKEIFLYWFHIAYVGALRQSPQPGQVLFIAGPQNVGKTLLNRGIVAVIMGGYAEPHDWLNGRDLFNSDLFNFGIWSVDDGSISAGPGRGRYWSENIKRIPANGEFRCNEKYRKGSRVIWPGRLIVTCNSDPESILQIPDLSISILDKVIILRTADIPGMIFPSRPEVEKILERELPYLCRYLLDLEIPKDWYAPRFGMKEFADPLLVLTAHQSSKGAGFSEILEDWKQEYFFKRQPEASYWQGTATQLVMQILLNPTMENIMRSFPVDAVGRHLVNLQQQGDEKLETISGGVNRIWRIHRPEKQTIA